MGTFPEIDKPEIPGWYWVRFPLEEWTCIELKKIPDEPYLHGNVDGTDEPIYSDIFDDAEFDGPIAQPGIETGAPDV